MFVPRVFTFDVMSCCVFIMNRSNDKRLLVLPMVPLGQLSYERLRDAIIAEESASPQLRAGAFQFCIQHQQVKLQLPISDEANAFIEITDNAIVFVKLIDNQPAAGSHNGNSSNNNVDAGTSAALSAATTSGPVTTVGGTTVTTSPHITGLSTSIVGPNITGPNITINMPQSIQQPAASVPKVVQSLVKKVGSGTRTMPAVGRPGAPVAPIFLSKQQREEELRQRRAALTANPEQLLLTHFSASGESPDLVRKFIITKYNGANLW